MFWWYTHSAGSSAVISPAWTAFSVVTLPTIFGNHLWLWLWPTALGVPAIVVTTAYYKRRFAPKAPIPQPALAV